jgi:hypothetical protein
MSLVVLTRPISGSSSFNATGNPIVYTLQRQDHAAHSGTHVDSNGGFVRIWLDSALGNVTSFYPAAETIYFYSSSGQYVGAHTITGNDFSGGHTRITTSTAHTGDAVGTGYVNNTSRRTDYKASIEVFRSSNNTSLNDVTFRFSPDETGLINVYVDEIVKPYLSAEWSNPGSVNEQDDEAFLKFYIKYQEFYDAALVSSPTSDSANPIYAVFGALQIGSTYGGNMREYFPVVAAFPSVNAVLWPTKFQLNSTLKKLVMWRDWPFSVSWIHPDALTNLKLRSIQYDASGTELTTAADTISPTGDDGVSRLKMPTINASTTKMTLQARRIR